VRGVPGAKQVALRDGVATVGLDADAQQLAAQVVGVGGAALGVERRALPGSFVDRVEAVGREGVRVVTRRQIQVALGVEVDLAADVTAPARSVPTSRMRCSDAGTSALFSNLKRESCMCPRKRAKSAAVPVTGAVALVHGRRRRIVERSREGRGVVDVQPVVLLKVASIAMPCRPSSSC
jgi:hypothetical protein